MKKRFDAVIFDLDGTLIDSMWVWAEIDRLYLAQFGLEVPPDIDSALEGKSFTESARYFKERFGIEDSIEMIKEKWNRLAWSFYAQSIPLKKGAKEFLEYLKQEGIPMGIATSNSIELVQAALENLEIKQYFNSIRTSCEVEKGKPYPYIYQKVADDLEVDPKRCLVFEDVPNGVLAGQRAGMEVWAVEDRQTKEMQEILKGLACNFIKDYHEALVKLKIS